MTIKNGSVGFHVSFVVPNVDTERMESFLKTHEDFMRDTHHVTGHIEPLILCYTVLKSVQFNNPFDPNSGETGNTLYGITEIYQGSEGAIAHLQIGQKREAMFAQLVSLTNDYCVCAILGGPVIRSMFDR
ncbi:hypothetical protein [Winogradskyella aurantiaca]|uniref:hypothetical protein n=1 Tax=Winogradskyella aurantiaca TaxID=2219558 RepID=UPI0013002FE8|nr:hypothetical protein [Winogradskyella aurantiaca]